MDTVDFGRTGVSVSRLCLGCMMFGGRTGLEDSCRIIDRAMDEGINFLDTANVYSRGASEEVVGEALKRNKGRSRTVLATKVHGRMEDEDPNAWRTSRRHIIEQCEASLKRLKTDWIDLYQLHRPRPEIAIDETLRALDDLIRSGKVRYIGTSTFAAWQVIESLWASRDLGLNRFVCEQPPYNILDRRIERELLPMARTYSIATIPWSPIGGGLLTGKYRKGRERPADGRFGRDTDNPFLQSRYTEGALDVVERLIPLAENKGVPLSQFSLAWVLQQPGVTAPIIGPRTLEQLEDNLQAVKVALSEDELKQVDAIVPPGEMVSPFYNADFGPHSHRW